MTGPARLEKTVGEDGSERRVNRWATGIAVALGIVATLAVVAAVLVAPTAETDNPTADVVTQVLLAVLVGIGLVVSLVVFGRRLSPTAVGFLVALLTGLFLYGGAAIELNANAFGPIGATLDQGYRTAYVTKFNHTWHLVDYAYKDLPSFYPPLYFWVLGRLSAVLGIAAWHMIKVGMLAVAFIVPTAGWLLWRPMTGPRRAAVVVVATSLLFQDWYTPHLWLATAVFVPWWCWYVLGAERARRLTPSELVAAVALGTVVALTYWYVLLIGIIQLAILLALRWFIRRRGGTPEPRSLRDVGIILGGVVVVTAVYWIPLAVSFVTTSGAQTMQNRYFVADEVSLPMPFFEGGVEGFVLLFGLVALALTANRRALSRQLLGLIGAAYLLYLIGYIGFLADTPLDTLRAHGIIEFPLAVGAALGAIELARLLATRRLHELVDPSMARTVTVVGAVVLVFAVGQHAVRDIPYLKEQRAAEYPRVLLETFKGGTDGEYADSVVLTDVPDLSTFLPTYTFNTSDAHYSHPAALFNDRADLLKLLSREADARVFELAFTHNRYDTIDYVALRDVGDALLYEYYSDAFPLGVGQEQLRFSRASFDSPSFTETANDGIVVYRVNPGRDPLGTLRSCPRDPQATKCQILGTVLNRYSSHLDDETRDLAPRWQRARR